MHNKPLSGRNFTNFNIIPEAVGCNITVSPRASSRVVPSLNEACMTSFKISTESKLLLVTSMGITSGNAGPVINKILIYDRIYVKNIYLLFLRYSS